MPCREQVIRCPMCRMHIEKIKKNKKIKNGMLLGIILIRSIS